MGDYFEETGRLGVGDLLPCPFCGSDKVKVIPAEKGRRRVKCCNCGARGPIADKSHKVKAVNSWNGTMGFEKRLELYKN